MKLSSLMGLLLLSQFGLMPCAAQMKALSIGDTVPNIMIENIVNYKTKTTSLAAFKGKLLILDFWATWCTPCIAAFPSMDSLQKKFKDKIQFLPVTYQDEKHVSDFLQKMRNVKHFLLASAVEDTVLQKLFPYATLPHYVWINDKGIVVAITGKAEITTENIRGMLSYKEPSLRLKRESFRAINTDSAIFYENYIICNLSDSTYKTDRLKKNNFFFHSIMTGSIPDVHGYMSFAPGRFSVVNCSVLLMLRNYYGIMKKYGRDISTFFAKGRTIMDIKDTMLTYRINGNKLSESHNAQAMMDWGEKYAVCYELIVPDSTSEDRKNEIIKQDFDRYLGDIYQITFGIEQRNVAAMVLRKIITEDKLSSKGGRPVDDCNLYSIKLKNIPFQQFVNRLSEFNRDNLPIADSVNYPGNIDIELDCKINDYKTLSIELRKYGLALKIEEKVMDVLVLREKAK